MFDEDASPVKFKRHDQSRDADEQFGSAIYARAGVCRELPYLRVRRPLAQEPRPSPAIKLERTMETSGVVTPNCAMARRSQTSSYMTLQKPETKKKRNIHCM